LRRQRILDAACRAFSVHGYAGTSLTDVAAALDLTKAAVLHHFATKEALYFAALSETVGELGGMLSEAITADASYPQRLDRLGETVVDYFGARPSVARLILSELIGRGPFAQGAGKPLVQATLRSVVAFLEQGIAQGFIVPQSAEHLAISIISIHLLWFSTDLAESLIGDDPHAPARVAERKEAVLRSVRALCRGQTAR
jgi:AcrR family transcriptional regulator